MKWFFRAQGTQSGAVEQSNPTCQACQPESMGPALTCFDPYMETSYLRVFKVQIQVGVDLKFQDSATHTSNKVALCPSAGPKREFPNVALMRGEVGKLKAVKEMLSLLGVGQASSVRNEKTNVW